MQTVVPALALLHGEEVHFSWTQWDAHWSIIVGCVTLLALYFWGIGPAREKYALGEPASRWQITSFVSAVVILFVSLTGPIHDLSDTNSSRIADTNDVICQREAGSPRLYFTRAGPMPQK